MAKDKLFELSVTTEGDSVVQEGSAENLTTKYFGEYLDALEYLKKQCSDFVKIEYKYL